jgi:hypothetical protein
VAPGQDGEPTAPEPDEPAAVPPDHARAETYLRLRAEAELRRVQALPRPDPPGERELPAPLRGAVRLVLPPGRRAASILLPLAGQAFQVLQPLAENTGRALRPLTETAGRTLPPLAGNAARAVQPLADTAAQTVAPLASQVIGTVLPAADRAAQQLRPLAWQAAYRLQALGYSGQYRLTRWPGRARRVTATLRGARTGPTPAPWTPENMSADEGVHQLRYVADALVQAGAIDRGAADSVLNGLETALAARSRIEGYRLVMPSLPVRHRPQPTSAPAGPYLAVPIGAAVPAGPDSGLTDVRLMTLVIGPRGALVYAAGRVPEQSRRSQHLDPWPLFGADQPSAADDRGNSYQIDEDTGMSDGDGQWDGILRLSPVPPSGTRWLELTMSPGSPAIRVDLAGPGENERAPGRPPAGGPAERLIDAEALDLLQLSVADEGSPPRHDLSGIADIVTALEAVGALDPARGAVGRLVTLAGRLGVELPPALRAAAPPGDLPAAWAGVLANRHRRDGPRGTTPAAAVLPELDGTRFVLAGLRSYPAWADLYVMAWGPQHEPRLLEDTTAPWSWSARDDQDRWHIATVSNTSIFSDGHQHLRLRLVPPLHPQATSLEVMVAGPPGQAAATVPLDWEGPR